MAIQSPNRKHKSDSTPIPNPSTPATPQTPEIFEIMSANDICAQVKNEPAIPQIFGEFWYEGEVSILFAPANTGKTIFAMQIAQIIASGEGMGFFQGTGTAKDVLYFNFELSPRQLFGRYRSENGEYFKFAKGLQVANLKPNIGTLVENSAKFEEALLKQIFELIDKSKCKIIIIDNLSWIVTDLEKSGKAVHFVRVLKSKAAERGISVLLLAHTPKMEMGKILKLADLAGSAGLSNFVDSVFGIAASPTDDKIRYVKQLKVRADEFVYTRNNVAKCKVEKVDNFLMLDFIDTCPEDDLIELPTKEERQERFEARNIQQDKLLKAIGEQLRNGNNSSRKIAETLKQNGFKTNHNTVALLIRKYELNAQPQPTEDFFPLEFYSTKGDPNCPF